MFFWRRLEQIISFKLERYLEQSYHLAQHANKGIRPGVGSVVRPSWLQRNNTFFPGKVLLFFSFIYLTVTGLQVQLAVWHTR
jgi:hypothetical protein